MPNLIVVYWRDIPAQIIVGKGRKASKIQLSERFEQAIDRCAMKIDAKDSDAYLAEWRKSEPIEIPGSSDEIAETHAEKIENEYDNNTLKVFYFNIFYYKIHIFVISFKKLLKWMSCYHNLILLFIINLNTFCLFS